MNTQSTNNTDTAIYMPVIDGGRSMNSHLQRQSLKTKALFEGNGHLSDLVDANGQQEWARMEERLQRSRERIEKAIAARSAFVNAAQFDDDDSAKPIGLIS